MSKQRKPLDAGVKRVIIIVGGITIFSSLVVGGLAVLSSNASKPQDDGAAKIGALIPQGREEIEGDLPEAVIERVNRVQKIESDAARVAGRTYIPENYLGAPEDIRDNLEERVEPAYLQYQRSTDNMTGGNRAAQNNSTRHVVETEDMELYRDGLMRQLDLVLSGMQPATTTEVAITYQPQENPIAESGDSGGQEGGGGNAREGMIIGADEIMNAILLTPIDTYTTSFVLAEIVGGEFNGAQLRGEVVQMSGSGDVEDVGVRFSSLRQGDNFYRINAIALNEETATDAMNGSVDRRYISRYVMPIMMAGLSGVSTYFTAKGTPSRNIANSGRGNEGYDTDELIVTQDKASQQEARDQGIGQAIDKTVQLGDNVVNREASRPNRVKLPAQTAIGLIFNEPVYAKR